MSIAEPDVSLAPKFKLNHLISMRSLPIIAATILAVSAEPSAASPDRIPYLCGGPDVSDWGNDGPAPTTAMLVGTDLCSEEGVTVILRLDADGRFEERMEGEAADLAMPTKPSVLFGRWRIEGWILRLFEEPKPVPFKQRARVADARGDAVIVPFGITGAVLRRVTPGR